MLKRITIAENALDPATWETFETENVLQFLANRYDSFPDTARIYHKQVAENCDVTPSDEKGIERLGSLEGPFFMVVYPGEPMTIALVVVTVLSVAAAVFLQPPVPTLKNTQSKSPNNELSERENKPRPNQRLPEIYGTVRSTPDLISVPYRIFKNNREVELAYMCIGRGHYDVPASEILDDTTKVSEIPGVSVEVYEPFTSPNSGDTPQLRVGAAIDSPVYLTKRINAVNGQTLKPPNYTSNVNISDIAFIYPDKMQLGPNLSGDLMEVFEEGDSLTVVVDNYTANVGGELFTIDTSVKFSYDGVVTFETENTDSFTVGGNIEIKDAFYEYNGGADLINLGGTYIVASKTPTTLTLESVGGHWQNIQGNFPNDETPYKVCTLEVPGGEVTLILSGTYQILSMSRDTITLLNPSSVNADWNLLENLSGEGGAGATDYLRITAKANGPKVEGPVYIDADANTSLLFNFVAPNGLYKDDGQTQYPVTITVAVAITPIDENGVALGPPEGHIAYVGDDVVTTETKGDSFTYPVTEAGRYSITAYRLSPADEGFSGTVVDEIKWRDLYVQEEVMVPHFGDVTTVYAQTYATAGALNVKNRKLNMLVTRKIPVHLGGGVFSQELIPTRNAADILTAVCLDPLIGNRDVSEIDLENIYDTVDEVVEYFGTAKSAEFSYTFDNDNLSFEETVSAIANSIFCKAYRRGQVLQISFEKETDDSTLLFNHRNKLPGSETRTVRFGTQGDNDGVEYEYVDPKDDAVITYYIPEDKSAKNPKKIESVGIRSKLQAHFHAWRAWNKIRYQNIASAFEATQEADLLVINDRILVSDNTRPSSQDGEVIEQNGLELTLSQSVNLSPDQTYSIFLQHFDGTVESIEISGSSDHNKVTLANAPRAPLSIGRELYATATYIVVGSAEPSPTAFLVSEKTPQSNFTSEIKAINYDSRYYSNDKDLENGVLDANGNPL